MRRNESEPVELALVLFHTTHAAVLVGDTGDRDKAVWLPLASIDFDPDTAIGREAEKIGGLLTKRSYPIFTITVPEWLATEKGLV